MNVKAPSYNTNAATECIAGGAMAAPGIAASQNGHLEPIWSHSSAWCQIWDTSIASAPTRVGTRDRFPKKARRGGGCARPARPLALNAGWGDGQGRRALLVARSGSGDNLEWRVDRVRSR
jgi:hypothetical protein